MDKLAPDPDTAPLSSDPDYDARILEWCSGTYSSGWSTLKMACASSLQATARHTHEDIATATRILEKNDQLGAVSFFIGVNYSIHILGPALSTVILSAMCLESFLRIGFQVTLETNRRRKQRREGFDEVLRARLAAFDESTIIDRIRTLVRETGAKPLAKNDPLQLRLVNLITYRNECVHDAPILRTGKGDQLKAPGKRPERLIHDRVGQYERLGLTLRPVRLRHAIHAVDTHDKLIDHVFGRGMGRVC